MEPGESVSEACLREVFEETGLTVRIIRLTGIYSSPDRLVTYADGNRWQVVAPCFEAEVTGGEPGLSDETTAADYFTLAEIQSMDVMENHAERVEDAFAARPEAFIR